MLIVPFLLVTVGFAINMQLPVCWVNKQNDIELLPASSLEERIRINSWEDAVVYARSYRNEKLEEALVCKRPNMPFDRLHDSSLLDYACSSGYFPLVTFLLKRGANEYEKNNMGTTILMFACCTNWNKTGNREDNRKIIRYLLSKGHGINERSENGMTALLITALYGDVETLQYLEKQGANPRAVMNDGCSALMLATMNQDVSIVRYLLERIPDTINAQTTLGERALDCALPRPSEEIIRMLIDGGAIRGDGGKKIPEKLNAAKTDEKHTQNQ